MKNKDRWSRLPKEIAEIFQELGEKDQGEILVLNF